MTRLRLALLSLVLASWVVPTMASAGPVAAVDDDPTASDRSTAATDEPTKGAPARTWRGPLRIEGGIGVRWGSFLINNVDATGTVKQLHLDGGFRARGHRLFVYAQYALQTMQIPLDELAARSGTPVAIGNGSGLMHRFAAHGRYSFARGGEADGGLDLYADAGLGVQHIRWDAGGAWTRPDVQFALGVSGFGVGDTQHGGLSTAIVLTLAPRNDVADAGMACGGPCDYATKPTGVDRSLMFDVTLQFGK